MATIREQINDAIKVLSSRRGVFSIQDVVAYASVEGLEHDVTKALRTQCEDRIIIRLDEHRYMKTDLAEKWWVNHTIRWAITGPDRLTHEQLALTMSRVFLPTGDTPWDTPPPNLVAVGQIYAMVCNGFAPGTFVSPWASVLKSHPQFIRQFRTTFASMLSWFDLKGLHDDTQVQDDWAYSRDAENSLSLDDTSINFAVREVLHQLSDKESDIIRSRLGIDVEYSTTLERIGGRYGVTRERVRQIQKKALGKLGRPSYSKYLWHGFATSFIRSGGSLLIPESSMTPHRRLLIRCIDLNIVHITELGLYAIGIDDVFVDYRKDLHNIDSRSFEMLQFLSRRDATYLRALEEKYQSEERERRYKRSVSTLPRMLLMALRSLGRAAHYQEIAEECNRLFSDDQKSTHSWHVALSRPESEELGIVRIGQKGMYGLKEHGYSRPDAGIFDSVAQIVEEKFLQTHRPVSIDVVMVELGKQRRELKRSSVAIALGLSKKLNPASGGGYVPRANAPDQPTGTPRPQYDINAAFKAFSGGGNDV